MAAGGLVELGGHDLLTELAIVVHHPPDLGNLVGLRKIARADPGLEQFDETGDECFGQIIDRVVGGLEEAHQGPHVEAMIGGPRQDVGGGTVDQPDLAGHDLGHAVCHQLADLDAVGPEAEPGVVDLGLFLRGFAVPGPQHSPLQTEDVGQVGSLTHAGEELGDVGGVVTLAQQLADGVELGQVVIVVEGGPAVPARRVQESPLAVGADVAHADPRDPRQLLQPVLSHDPTPLCAAGLGRTRSCDHCSPEDNLLSEVTKQQKRMFTEPQKAARN